MADSTKKAIEPQKRYSPLIRPTDEVWKAIEENFKDMLARPTVRIRTVLDEYFTAHERKLFLPATEPRSLRDCQEDNTRRYHALLSGRFSGHPPSLATKFTMLYFGLPVEPVLSHLVDHAKPDFDVEDWDELHDVEVRPPLHFLTAHDRRNYGQDHMRGTEAHYSTIPVPASQLPETTAPQGLSLRGGGSDDDDDHDMLDFGQSRAAPGTGPFRPRTGGVVGNNFSNDGVGRRRTPFITSTRPADEPGGTSNDTRAATGRPFPTFPTGGFGGGNGPNTSAVLRGLAPPVSFGDSSLGQARLGGQSTSSSENRFARLYGFQGQVMFRPNQIYTLQEAARKLLSLKRNDQSDMVLAHIDRQTGGVVRSFETNISLEPSGEIAQYLDQQSNSNPDCVWFLHRRGETTPAKWEPQEADFLTTLVKLSHTNSDGHEDLAYYKLPPQHVFFLPSTSETDWPALRSWGVNQYMPFLTTAQEVLVGRPDRPGGNHADLVISGVGSHTRHFTMRWYGGIEINHQLWNMLHPHISRGKPFQVEYHPFAEDSVVFYLPRSRRLRECRRKGLGGSGDPYSDALDTISELIKEVKMPIEPSRYRIWRGTDFFNPSITYPDGDRKPVQWRHLDPVAHQREDREALSKFIADAVGDTNEPCRFFVIQPVDGNVPCTLYTKDRRNGEEEFKVDSHRVETLKSKVKKLYEGHPRTRYDPDKDVIVITPDLDREWNETQFVLRPDASDHELVMVRRLLVAQRMEVSLIRDDTLDFARQLDKTPWGPRYGEVARFRPEMGLPTLLEPTDRLPKIASKQLPPVARKPPRKEPRATTWAKQPSVFDKGIYNPSIPINAPPVEQVMRTGGSRVPMVTKNVLTATEQRQLQNDFWTIRGMVLDRLYKCPYQGCKFTHRLDEEKELLRHLQEAHVGDKCPWCDVQLFAHWSCKQREEHFKVAHADEIRKILNMPSRIASAPVVRKSRASQNLFEHLPSSKSIPTFTITERARPAVGPLPRPSPPARADKREADYRYCDRCGRDHRTLDDKADREHHDVLCVPLAEGAGRCTFCETCGDRTWNTEEDAKELGADGDFPHRCRGTSHPRKPHCTKCGFSMKSLTDEAVDRHREYCGGYFNTLGCFCPYCQTSFVRNNVQEPVEDIKKHFSECSSKTDSGVTPYEIYDESYWRHTNVPTDPLYLGRAATGNLVNQQRRPNVPSRSLSHPLLWHDKPGPRPVQDPPSECTIDGCREPLFGLTPSEVLGHFEKKHGGKPQKRCPLCHLSFRLPEDLREGRPKPAECADRALQVAHMECHVYQLWNILAKGPPAPYVEQEPFYAGHTLWDPDNESALDRRDKRCPHFDKCGAMVGFMNQRQWNIHMETAHAGEDFEAQLQWNRAADMKAVYEARREQRVREGRSSIPGYRPGLRPEDALPVSPVPEGNDPPRPRPGNRPGTRSGGNNQQEGPPPRTPPETPGGNTGGHRPGGGTGHTGGTSGDTGGTSGDTGGKTPGRTKPKPNKDPKTGKTKPGKKTKPADDDKPDFDPTDDMYCSRCFRKAPKKGGKTSNKNEPDRQEQVNAHSDPNRSCQIRPEEGKVTLDTDGKPRLPSKVGWIRKISGHTFANLRKEFVTKNPQLEKTMCPTDGRTSRRVHTWQHDPNNDSNSGNWGLPFGDGESEEDESDGDDSYKDDNDGEGDDNDEGEEDDDDEEGNDSKPRKEKRKTRRGGVHDPTYRDNGEGDDLSEADPKELVPESGDEGRGKNDNGKRKRDEQDGDQHQTRKEGETEERDPKRTKTTGEDGGQGDGQNDDQDV